MYRVWIVTWLSAWVAVLFFAVLHLYLGAFNDLILVVCAAAFLLGLGGRPRTGATCRFVAFTCWS